METQNETTNIRKDGSDCDFLSSSAQMRVSHGPLCYMCENFGDNNKREMTLYLLLFQ